MDKYKKILIIFILLFALTGIFTFELASGKDPAQAESYQNTVYLGGTPMGVVAKSDGVTIVNITDVATANGTVSPSKQGGLEKGDLIIKIDTYDIKCPEDIAKALASRPECVKMMVVRCGNSLTFSVRPAEDINTKTLKLGLHVKNELAGVGTLTYVRADTKRFGGLGHMIFESDRNKDIYKFGHIYGCSIEGIVKGEAGRAGELRGSFNRYGDFSGKIDKNLFCGIYGVAEQSLYDKRPLIAVGSRNEVIPGKAYIYTTVSGNKPDKYEIEIVKAMSQNEPCDKSMVIRVTDKRLLDITGGIVQGMSGSPIIQNGKLIGAVTHVFINDLTRGYGIYTDWMLNN